MIRAINKMIDLGIKAFMATMIVIVGYVLFDMNAVAKGSELDEDIMMVEPKNNDFDISKLKEINSDIVGWITINNTDINYPILQADDNGHYLSRNYRNEFATAGSIFLDYRDNFIDDVFLIIYGHRMSYGKMFSDVTKYSEKDYFDEHLDGELYIGNDKKKLEVIGFAKISAEEKEVYGKHRDVEKVAKTLRDNAFFWRNVDGCRYVLLSTCDARDKTLRDVLLLTIRD